VSCKARAEFVVAALAGGRSRIDDDVHGREFLLAVAERFSGEALQTIALDGVAGRLHTYREPEPCVTRIIGSRDHLEQRVR
jgi:hypothetical protein